MLICQANLSTLGLYCLLASISVTTAIVVVAVSLGLGLRQRAVIVSVGAVAGLVGFVAVNVLHSYGLAGDDEVYLTNFEYNRVYFHHQILSIVFAAIALGLGAVVGIILRKWWLRT